MTKQESTLRKQLVTGMSGRESHISFESAVQDFPADLRGVRPPGAPHTAWQLLEHMRIAQHDILEFSRDPNHQSPDWPQGFWPKMEAPPDGKAWNASVKAFEHDARELEKLISDTQQDLFKPFAHGTGQNLFRQALLVATHNSYHLGQLMFLKKQLMA